MHHSDATSANVMLAIVDIYLVLFLRPTRIRVILSRIGRRDCPPIGPRIG
ncbi:hypothetical protein OPAG_07695 [Rhodococcus opacus PD630]|nr:hypothetical protein Pd630_LPD02019 [Rhodococcus opacus PD630]EHI45587.1 hypothetical protein OPAG_07695 [Rhodococcus opacus PD630]